MTRNVKVFLMGHIPEDAEEIVKETIGLRKEDKLEIITPQFDRTDGIVISYFPRTVEEFDGLKTISDAGLRAIGCQKFDDKLWLYPAEWYWNIPNGYKIMCLDGCEEMFVPGKTDDDKRFGALAFGFYKE